MTIRWSAVNAISLMRWLETNTVRPSAARRRNSVRIQRIPSGSRPLTGSSHSSTPGSPSSAAARPSRCRMPSENFPARRGGHAVEADEVEHLVHPPGADAVALGQAEQVMERAAPAVQRAGLEHRAHLVQRAPDVRVGAAVDQHRAAGRPVQAEDHPHRGRLAGAVGSEEAGDDAGTDVEAELVDGPHRAVVLAQPACTDHGHDRALRAGARHIRDAPESRPDSRRRARLTTSAPGDAADGRADGGGRAWLRLVHERLDVAGRIRGSAARCADWDGSRRRGSGAGPRARPGTRASSRCRCCGRVR